MKSKAERRLSNIKSIKLIPPHESPGVGVDPQTGIPTEPSAASATSGFVVEIVVDREAETYFIDGKDAESICDIILRHLSDAPGA